MLSAAVAMLPPAGVLLLAATASVTMHSASWCGIEGPACPLGHWLGEVACPGCGLTRATACVVQGRWFEALQLHPAAFVLVAGCVGLLGIQVDVMRRGAALEGHRTLQWLGGRLLAASILLAWGIRFALGMRLVDSPCPS